MSSNTGLRAEQHPAFPDVEMMVQKYKTQGGPLLQTFCDLNYAASWRDLQVLDIVHDQDADLNQFGANGWAIILGRAPHHEAIQAVLPMSVEQSFDSATFSEIFKKLPEDVDASHILLAMMSNDSTVVYYKLSKGLVKPVN
ncbi:hypothetical protein MPSI1_002877 [Malassezia psittaci]|uniref:tRNA-splicing endonuclease subunit Sen15 domain-containing protein n=1 Tax=Malassezia psittaci TaxID=1821823 RepID=A0AAF0F6T7_9BASI|nr:hypothetical protein MPSI1_002877 [Malassezia psittaci]